MTDEEAGTILDDTSKQIRAGRMNLYDATATDLSDLYTTRPDPAAYKVLPVDQRIFDPATVRQSTSGKPGPRMDRQ